jgi:hypothetical protein
MNRHAFVAKQIKEKAPKVEKPKAKGKLSKALPRNIVNGNDEASRTIRDAALNIMERERTRQTGDLDILANVVMEVTQPRPRRRRTTRRRNLSPINRRLLPPAIVCMTGIGPRSRSELISILEDNGYTYNNNPARAQILVFNPEQTASESVKFRNARRNPDVAMVPYDTFFRRML